MTRLRIIGWRFCHARDRAVSKRSGSERIHAIDGTKYYSTTSYRVSRRWAPPSGHIGPEGTCHLQRDWIGQTWFHSTWKYPSWFSTVSGSVVRFHARQNRHGPLGFSRNQDISVRITFATTYCRVNAWSQLPYPAKQAMTGWPRQTDGISCGIYVCVVAERVSRVQPRNASCTFKRLARQ